MSVIVCENMLQNLCVTDVNLSFYYFYTYICYEGVSKI